MSEPADGAAGISGHWPELLRVRRAIVVVDVVESVRLMQAYEADIIDRWRRFVAEVRDTLLPGFGGRMVKSLGDGMLLEFDAVPQAIAAAQAIQQAVRRYNTDRPVAACIHLRAGIHIADVVRDEVDLFGAGVNYAARLASLASPGDCLASAQAQAEAVAGLHCSFEDQGEAYVKHLDAPIRSFRIVDRVASQPARPAPLPDRTLKPSVVVVPFAAQTRDPAFDAIGHALADDINAALSRSRDLSVISRLSAAGFSTGAWSAADIRVRLGVAYVLSGVYHVYGQRVKVHVELCDAREERVVWAASLAADVADFFNSQDAMVPEIVAQIGHAVMTAEFNRSASLPVATLEGYTLYLGGVNRLHRLVPDDFSLSHELFQHLSERQPRAAAPHAMLAKWHILRMVQGWSPDPEQETRLARSAARRAMELDPRDAFSLATDGMVSVLMDNDLDAGGRQYQRALDANPHEPYAWALQSGLHSYRDQPEQAVEAAERAVALSPLDPTRFLFESYLSIAHLTAGDYTRGVQVAQSSLRLNALHTSSHRLLVIGLMLAGRGDEARAAARTLVQLEPGFRVERYARWFPGRHTRHGSRFAEALREAGVPY